MGEWPMTKSRLSIRPCLCVGGFIAPLLFFSGCSVSKREQPAPKLSHTAPKSYIFHAPDHDAPIRTFEQISALPSEEFDVAEALLALAQESGAPNINPKRDPRVTLQEIDELAEKARDTLPENPDGQDYFDALFEIALNKKSAEAFREDRAEDYDLAYTISRHRGSCLSVGIMTLAVARRMNAPIWGAQCPNHFFLRYVPAPDANGRVVPVNFDVTRLTPQKWTQLDDDFYRKWQHFDQRAEEAGAYLRPLSDREVVSAFLSSRAGFFATKKSFKLAIHDAERALQLNDRNVTACINGGYAQEAMGNLPEGHTYYKRALEIDPSSLRARNNMAYLKVQDPKSKLFDPKGAEVLIEEALKEAPEKAWLHATYGEVKAAEKDWRAATRGMQQAQKLDPENPRYRERFMQFREKLRAEN
jgi:regulator of sirC expression with transglutaminase-like and TPR domain